MKKSAMILAAGLGLRMRPLTNTTPKPLISVKGKTMLQRAYEHLKTIDVASIVVNAHYLPDQIIAHAQALDPDILISEEEVLLETAGGIKKALPLLGEGTFFTLNGDTVWTGSASLKAMEQAWDSSKMDALLLLVPKESAHGYEGRGDFFLDPEGRLLRPQKEEAAPYVYMGVQLTHSPLFDEAPEGPLSLNVLWNKALAKGRLFGLLHRGDWYHISTPGDLENYK
jgi:MurNAc alpha-1-phosphate uridylyltransferase